MAWRIAQISELLKLLIPKQVPKIPRLPTPWVIFWKGLEKMPWQIKTVSYRDTLKPFEFETERPQHEYLTVWDCAGCDLETKFLRA